MSMTRILGLASCALSVLAFGACGGGNDKEDAEQTIRDIASATSDSDGGKFCGLVTNKLREQMTGASGDKANDNCKKLIDSQKGRKVKVAKITDTQVKGNKATVTAVLEDSGRKRPQVFRLKKEDGEFRLASAGE